MQPQEENNLKTLSALLGAALILVILWEGFETVVLPRQVTRRARLTRIFYRYTWRPFATIVRKVVSIKHQETYLSFFGPLSLLLLLGVWAGGMIIGFGLLYWATGSVFKVPEGNPTFMTYLYLSGTTFFTLGMGDITPGSTLTRGLTVVEAGLGFGFLALVLSYLPALNQSFARREVRISLLDARAGSPPTAVELLRRHSDQHGMEALRQLFYEWEHWSAELLESHLSYPVLAYFRSQHDNQSWLAALMTIMDSCALIIVGLEGACERQAELTFAMARHAVVDLVIVFRRQPRKPDYDRLPADELARVRATLAEAGLRLREGPDADRRLTELRQMYEPYVYALSKLLRMSLPSWIHESRHVDNWQTSQWEQHGEAQKTLLQGDHVKRHF
jgi:hypothetical protein